MEETGGGHHAFWTVDRGQRIDNVTTKGHALHYLTGSYWPTTRTWLSHRDREVCNQLGLELTPQSRINEPIYKLFLSPNNNLSSRRKVKALNPMSRIIPIIPGSSSLTMSESSVAYRDGPQLGADGKPLPLDFTHYLSEVTKRRQASSMKKYYRFFQIPGIKNLAGGSSFFSNLSHPLDILFKLRNSKLQPQNTTTTTLIASSLDKETNITIRSTKHQILPLRNSRSPKRKAGKMATHPEPPLAGNRQKRPGRRRARSHHRPHGLG